MWLRCYVAIVIVLGGFFAFACNDNTSDEDPAALLSSALENLTIQKTVRTSQTMEITVLGENVQMSVEGQTEFPSRGYVRQTALGRVTEVFIDGATAYTKVESALWSRTSLEALGIKPESIYEPIDIKGFISEVQRLPDVTEDNRRLRHFRIALDGEEFGDRLAALFEDGSPAGAIMSDAEIRRMEIDYYISADDNLPARGTMTFEMEIMGIESSVSSDFAFRDYNEPFLVPPGLPAAR